MKEKLLKLIKLIANNNHFVVPGKGIRITKENINHQMLAKHRDTIGELCTGLGLSLIHRLDVMETVTDFQVQEDGSYQPVEVEQFAKNRKGYDMKESIWIGKSLNSDEDAIAVL